MTFYIFLFVIVTIPLLFLVCVLGGGMLGGYLGQQMANFRPFASNYPMAAVRQEYLNRANWLGSLCGWCVAVTLVMAFYFFGSIR